MAARTRDQDGIGIVEVLVAILLLLIGIGATIGMYAATQRQTHAGMREAQAAALAERELEELSQRPYDEVGLAATNPPVHVATTDRNPSNPDAYVTSSGNLQVVRDPHDRTASGNVLATEDLDLAGTVPHLTQGVTVGQAKFDVYRYVSWRDEQCAPTLPSQLSGLQTILQNLLGGLFGPVNQVLGAVTGSSSTLNVFCAGSTHDSKRVTVAVVAQPGPGATSAPSPVWMSTVVTDEHCGIVNLSGGASC